MQLFNDDIRITITNPIYYNELFHEMGHTIYMQEISPKRYFRNMRPKSIVFDEAVALLYELFINPKSNLFTHSFDAYSKRIETSNILRTLHIVIRYEIERDLINGVLDVENLYEAYNIKYKQYFMNDYKENEVNIFDDAQWFNGVYGYFPVYNISFLVAYMIYEKYNFRNKTPFEIKNILSESILKYGNEISTEKILENIGVFDFKREYTNIIKRLENI